MDSAYASRNETRVDPFTQRGQCDAASPSQEEDLSVHTRMNKTQHHFLIAAWLVDKFGQDLLRSRRGYVVDVAGGLGKLDYELAVRYGIPSVLIDPKFSVGISPDAEAAESERSRDAGGEDNEGGRRSTLQLSSMHRRKMKKLTRSRLELSCSGSGSGSGHDHNSASRGCEEGVCGREMASATLQKEDQSPLQALLRLSGIRVQDDGVVLPSVSASIADSSVLPFRHIPQHFPLSHLDIHSDPTLLALLTGASFIVGVHPDQVTEAMVDIAVQLRKPFAVVPCCVFTKLFPTRRTPEGGAVRSYEELVVHLKSKHRNISQGVLPFYGRNIVLYCSSYD